MAKHTTFQANWLNEPQFNQWLERVPNDITSARCNICKKSFNLSNMGRRAVSSHMSGAKHKNNEKASTTSASMKCYFKAQTNSSPVTKHIESELEPIPSISANPSPVPPPLPRPAHSRTEIAAPRGIQTLLLNENVTKAEILWSIQSVMTHSSLRTAGRNVSLFSVMFPDSDIAKKMKLQKDKVGYTLAFGIAPFFNKLLIEKLSSSDFITVGFDESLNKVSQKNQMDVNVRFWDSSANEVRCCYLTSVFLGKSTANDLLVAFSEAIKPLDRNKILQVSLDGPNVNKKFLKDLKDMMIQDPDSKKLLDIGSCGLHTV
uniref:BED-type domain-containing protein n=2 Tax=Graphocephala atropunctata TaxID=36148 RepID=A0A1B6KAK6_9HEMI